MTREWVDRRRRELDELELEALEWLARSSLALGGPQLRNAERASRALISRSPFRETGYRFLMESLAGMGNAAEALRVYEELRVLLRDELGASPAAEVQELHKQLLAGEGARPDRPSESPPPDRSERIPLPSLLSPHQRSELVGREQELDVLRAAWRQARSGNRRLVVVVGDPGIGKTRLTSELALDAHRDGAVLYAACQEEALLTYQPFVETLRHYARSTDVDWQSLHARARGRRAGAARSGAGSRNACGAGGAAGRSRDASLPALRGGLAVPDGGVAASTPHARAGRPPLGGPRDAPPVAARDQGARRRAAARRRHLPGSGGRGRSSARGPARRPPPRPAARARGPGGARRGRRRRSDRVARGTRGLVRARRNRARADGRQPVLRRGGHAAPDRDGGAVRARRAVGRRRGRSTRSASRKAFGKCSRSVSDASRRNVAPYSPRPRSSGGSSPSTSSGRWWVEPRTS